MKPIGISERLLYNTVMLVTDTSAGTGFFFNFLMDGQTVPVLITNRHVVEPSPLESNPDKTVSFYLHLLEEDGSTTKNVAISLETEWFLHPSHDLCFTFINPLFEEVKWRTGKDVDFVGIDEKLIPTQYELSQLTAIEEIVVVGYPTGLWDVKRNLPVFRKGYTANHPAHDFNWDGIGLADIATFPGSSGSPVFIFNESGYTDKAGNYHMGTRLLFLGVLMLAGYGLKTKEFEIEDIPIKVETDYFSDVGYYIKSSEILDFKNIVRRELRRI